MAILGAGIMGSSLALFLARRKIQVSLFDKEQTPIACASRWNEGKIHLGYLYGADQSLRTARHILPGGLAFKNLVSELVDSDITQQCTSEDDIYLLHRRSVVDREQIAATFDNISELVRQQKNANDYLVDVSSASAKRLSQAELGELTNSEDVIAGFSIPERSVNTQWVADRISAALQGVPHINLRCGTTVREVGPVDSIEGEWSVRGDPHLDERFDVVVNALWNGRLEIDLTAGIKPLPGWSHRYRLCAFVRTYSHVDTKSAVVVQGPFGDVKNYNGRDFYLSWYPLGLVAEGNAIKLEKPQELSAAQKQKFIAQLQLDLHELMPGTVHIFNAAEAIRVEGGFVFALGQGSIADPISSLHRRDRYGVIKKGNYFSVDTGKYSTAPWYAERLANEICGY